MQGVVMVPMELKVQQEQAGLQVLQVQLAHKELKVQLEQAGQQVVRVLVLLWKVKLLIQALYQAQATRKVMLI